MNIHKKLILLLLLILLVGCAGRANWQSLQKSGRKSYESGRFSKAKHRLTESNDLLFAEHPLDEGALPSLEILGYIYQIEGINDELEDIYLLEWDILVAADKIETAAGANALYKLASLAHKNANFPKADSLYLKVLELDRKVLGSSHPYIDLDHYKLAAVKYQSGDLLGAESYLLAVLDLRTNNVIKSDQVTEVITTIISFYEFQGLYTTAEPFYRRALETFSRTDPDNPEVADIWLNYSKLLDRLGMSQESMIARAKSDELITYYMSKASAQLDILETIRARNAVKLAALNRGEIWLPIAPGFDVWPGPIGGLNAINNNIEYPTIMLRYDVQGTIIVASWIDTRGQVRETLVTSGQEVELYYAAKETVRKVKFFPAFHRGRAEKSWVAVPVTFELLVESEGY